MRRYQWQLIWITLAVTGCTSMCGAKRSSLKPEQVVERYLDIALNMKDVAERDNLLDYTTGALKAAIESATPEVIRTAYVDRKYHIINYSVVERKDRTPRETEVTFQLLYNDLGVEGKPVDEAPTVTTENTVAVIKENGQWVIRDVLGNKTSIDFPVSAESRITAKPGAGIDAPEDMPMEAEGDSPGE